MMLDLDMSVEWKSKVRNEFGAIETYYLIYTSDSIKKNKVVSVARSSPCRTLTLGYVALQYK